MTIDFTLTSTAAALRDVDAEVHLPGDPGYDAGRTPWNVAVDLRPAAVAFPTTAREVSRIVVAAREDGLRIAPQSTGHNADPLSHHGLDDVVLVKTSKMHQVSINPGHPDRPGRGWHRLAAGGRGGRCLSGSPRCTDPRLTSAWPGTPSAAASSCTPASSGWRPTA